MQSKLAAGISLYMINVSGQQLYLAQEWNTRGFKIKTHKRSGNILWIKTDIVTNKEHFEFLLFLYIFLTLQLCEVGATIFNFTNNKPQA